MNRPATEARRTTNAEHARDHAPQLTPETAASSTARSTISLAVVELMFRYELGDFDATVRRRLADIFCGDRPDALARLERACVYLGVDGSGLVDAMRRSDEQEAP